MSNLYIKARMVAMVLAVGAALLLQPAAEAASLWTDQSGMFGDRKARTVGDTLTIIISEVSSATRAGKADNSKSTSVNMNAGTGLLTFINDAGVSASDSFKNEGKISNTNAVTGKITVQVMAVKPNGNLVVSGTQSIKQNGEEQKITVSGEVRPEDVSADNTVMSSLVANAQLKIDGKGPLAGKQRQGILTQVFNFLF